MHDHSQSPERLLSVAKLRPELRALSALALPLMIAQLAQMGTGVVDTIMAGRYSSVDLAAIAIGYNIWLPVYLISLGIMLAVTSIAAQHYGAGRIEDIRRLLPQAVWLAGVLGILSVPLCLFPGPILAQLSLDPATFDKAEAYLQATALGLPGAALFQALRCHVQGVGIIRPFAIASVIGFFANIPLNYAFIYGHWGIPEMGAAGCGYATAISMWLSPLLITFYTLRSKALADYLPPLRWHPPQAAIIGEIFSLGFPIGLTFFFEVAVFSVIGLMIATHGNTTMAAHQIGMNVYDVLYMPLIAIGSAMTTRIGHAIGQQNMTGVRISILCGGMVSAIFSLGIMLFMFTMPDIVARLYTADLDIRQLSASLLRLAALFVFFDMVAVITSSALRAFKDTRFPFLVMAIAYWLVALPVGYYLGLSNPDSASYGAIGFWWAMIAGIAVAGLLTSLRLKVFLRRPLPVSSTDSQGFASG
jgi:MATE family multidrug resistance protein